MVRDTLTAAFYETQQKHAHPTFRTLQMLEQARLAVWRGALKIRVSMVRFRPRPPISTLASAMLLGFFLLRAVLQPVSYRSECLLAWSSICSNEWLA